MNEEEFKSTCPNLWNAISMNQKYYSIYGIIFKSHSFITLHYLIEQYENTKATNTFGKSKLLNEIIPLNLN